MGEESTKSKVLFINLLPEILFSFQVRFQKLVLALKNISISKPTFIYLLTYSGPMHVCVCPCLHVDIRGYLGCHLLEGIHFLRT